MHEEDEIEEEVTPEETPVVEEVTTLPAEPELTPEQIDEQAANWLKERGKLPEAPAPKADEPEPLQPWDEGYDNSVVSRAVAAISEKSSTIEDMVAAARKHAPELPDSTLNEMRQMLSRPEYDVDYIKQMRKTGGHLTLADAAVTRLSRAGKLERTEAQAPPRTQAVSAGGGDPGGKSILTTESRKMLERANQVGTRINPKYELTEADLEGVM